jgi:hypothetical protein
LGVCERGARARPLAWCRNSERASTLLLRLRLLLRLPLLLLLPLPLPRPLPRPLTLTLAQPQPSPLLLLLTQPPMQALTPPALTPPQLQPVRLWFLHTHASFCLLQPLLRQLQPLLPPRMPDSLRPLLLLLLFRAA